MLYHHWVFDCIFKITLHTFICLQVRIAPLLFFCIFSCLLLCNWTACSFRISVHPIALRPTAYHLCPKKKDPLTWTNCLVCPFYVFKIFVGGCTQVFKNLKFCIYTWLYYLFLYKFMIRIHSLQLISLSASLTNHVPNPLHFEALTGECNRTNVHLIIKYLGTGDLIIIWIIFDRKMWLFEFQRKGVLH